MQCSVTNIDEHEIAMALSEARVDLHENSKKYDSIEWVELDDDNNNNYTNPVKWDTTSLKAKFPVFRESYAAIPLEVATSNPNGGAAGAATPYTAASRLAVKTSVLSFISAIRVKPIGGGATLVNEQEYQTPLMNSIRLLTETDIDWIECSGPELHFFGADRQVATSPMGVLYTATSSQSHISAGQPSNEVAGNAQLADRVSIFSAQSDHTTDVAKFKIIVTIPLKYVHSFFDQLAFPLPNYPLNIQLSVAGVTNGQTGWAPLTCPKQKVLGAFDAAGAPAVAALAAAVDAPKLSIVTSLDLSAKGWPVMGTCKLFVKCVKFNGAEGARFDKMLTDGYKKTITYLTSDLYTAAGVKTSATGVKYHRVFAENIQRPVRLWAMFPPAGSMTSSTSTFPSTVGPCTLGDCNVKINGTIIRPTNYVNQLDFYNELRQHQAGSSYNKIQGGPISFNDFNNGMRLYLFDVSRNASVINNMPITFTFDGLLKDPAANDVDVLFLVERYQTAIIDISKSKASTLVEDGIKA